MTPINRRFVSSILLIGALVLNLLNVNIAFADDGTPPPPPTEEPTQPPTEPPVTEVPVSVDPNLAPVETAPPVEEPPVTEILADLPEGTELVVLDESGNPISLASQEAAEAISEIDPMWCPAGVLPGGAGCTINFPTIDDLRGDMIGNTGSYTQNGVIYFTATAGGSLNFSIGAGGFTGAAFNTLKIYDLTFQGGWNGSTAAPAFSGQTDFANNSFTVGTSPNPWVGNITLKDFTFSNGNNSAITIFTTSGNITLNNVDVTNQIGNYAADLTSGSGNITIQNNSVFDGDNFNGRGVTATTGSGSITISDATFQQFKRSGAITNTWDGLTLSAPTVTLTNVISTDNDGDGISISNANIVTLNNVTSSNNGTELGAAGLAGNDGSGVVVSGLPGSQVYVNGGTFNNNQEYGVEIAKTTNTTLNILTTPTCTGNDSNDPPTSSCYNVGTVVDAAPPVITFVNRTPANGYGWNNTDVTVTWSCTDALSGVVNPTVTQTLSASGANQSATGTCQDLAGNTASNTQTGINIDKTPPTASASAVPAPNISGWNNSLVTVSFSGSDGLSGIDFCSPNVLLSTQGAGQSAAGTCTDKAGNISGLATASGINIDLTKPTLILPATITVEATGSTGAVVNYTASASDNLDPAPGFSCSNASGATFPVGTTTVNCSAIDQAGNIQTGSFNIIVRDTTGPTLSLPANITAQATSASGTVVTFSASASDLVDGSVTTTCTPSSGGTFPLGTTTVNCSATDSNSNTASGSFTVTVVDTTGPLLTLPANITTEATSSAGAIVNFTASANDSVDGSVAVTCTPASGATFALGLTTVNCSATDSRANTGSGSFTVTVQDTTPPALTLPGNITTEATSASGAARTFSASANDIVDGARTVTCVPPSGSTFPLGTTTVNCSASDTRANTASGSFTVTVVDTTAPSLTLPSNITVVASGPLGEVVAFSASATDLVNGPSPVTCLPASGSTFPLGITSILCSAADSRGNTANGSFNVTVQDTLPPVISPMADIYATTGGSGKVIAFASPATYDLVDGVGAATCIPASGSVFPIGITTVTCTASDSAGNTSSMTFNIQVNRRSSSTPTPNGNSFGGSIIVVTGGELLNLGCYTELYAFGVKLTFHNFCGHQTVITGMDADSLPASLPNGYTFVKGLDVRVLKQGKALENLPDGTGVEFDFPSPGSSTYAVLFWDGTQWIEMNETINDSQISTLIAGASGNELFRIGPTSGGHSKALTTELTGIFVLVKK